ncbi:hypothetical protein JYU34_018726 [Plutella xylostella]|uniref:Uncharacterized protein n=1 Tax=Plutella xylostella TaxID=51655 RepID=A0ABQ7PYC2_PLUXY|nr:hypothetical protein JYU34_018726 [Plutella xylostella]
MIIMELPIARLWGKDLFALRNSFGVDLEIKSNTRQLENIICVNAAEARYANVFA